MPQLAIPALLDPARGHCGRSSASGIAVILNSRLLNIKGSNLIEELWNLSWYKNFVVNIFVFLAVVGQFRRPEIRRFTSTTQRTVRKSSLTPLFHFPISWTPLHHQCPPTRPGGQGGGWGGRGGGERPTTKIFGAFSTFRPFSGRTLLDVPPKPWRFNIERPVLTW